MPGQGSDVHGNVVAFSINVVSDPTIGAQRFELIRGEDKCIRIGRANDSDIALLQMGVSHRNCELRLSESGRLCVKDLSTNGTFVDGQKVGRNQERPVGIGSRLQLSVVDPKAPDNHLE